jgi:hypothetical protein
MVDELGEQPPIEDEGFRFIIHLRSRSEIVRASIPRTSRPTGADAADAGA